MNRLIFVVESAPEGGYIARAIGTTMSAKAESLNELRDRVHETVCSHLGPCEPDSIGFFDLSWSPSSA